MPDLPETEHAVTLRCGQRIRIVSRADFTLPGMARGHLRRMHLFVQAGGREVQCAGPGFCRECNREGEAA